MAALPLLGCETLRLGNLVDIATRDQVQLAASPIAADDLTRSQVLLAEALEGADELLFAWGTRRLPGQTGALLGQQITWVQQHVLKRGFADVWMVAGSPRHPSRWRQFVGPEKQRVAGDCFTERLAKVLAREPMPDAPG